jgi:hypothetical protein
MRLTSGTTEAMTARSALREVRSEGFSSLVGMRETRPIFPPRSIAILVKELLTSISRIFSSIVRSL